MNRNRDTMQVVVIMLLTFTYALLRYVILHDVAWANAPIYVLNKAVSWSGVIYLGVSLLARDSARRRYFGGMAFAAIVSHLIMSLMVLNPAYFAKFFQDSGRMNAVGEWSMLAGVAGTLLLGGLYCTNLAGAGGSGTSLRAGWGRLILWCAVSHVAIMGYASWIAPGTWQGYLPPITLLSCASALIILYLRYRRSSH